MPEYLTVREVALFFRLKNEETIREWIKKGVFPNAIKMDGYLIPRTDVDQLVEKSKIAKICPPPPSVKVPPSVQKPNEPFVKRWKR